MGNIFYQQWNKWQHQCLSASRRGASLLDAVYFIGAAPSVAHLDMGVVSNLGQEYLVVGSTTNGKLLGYTVGNTGSLGDGVLLDPGLRSKPLSA